MTKLSEFWRGRGLKLKLKFSTPGKMIQNMENHFNVELQIIRTHSFLRGGGVWNDTDHVSDNYLIFKEHDKLILMRLLNRHLRWGDISRPISAELIIMVKICSCCLSTFARWQADDPHGLTGMPWWWASLPGQRSLFSCLLFLNPVFSLPCAGQQDRR